MARRILHIDLDAFFVAVERRLDPRLFGRPVAVGGRAGERGVVACASYEARAYGLKAGMPLASAQRLCPQCIFLPGNFDRYAEASEGFFAILRDYSPDVEPLSLDEGYVDLTGFEPHYGPALQAAQVIQGRIQRELGLSASIGIASGKVVAKVATDTCKPHGVLEVPPGEEHLFLAPRPLGDLPGLGPKTQQVLLGMGIKTLGHLASTPVSLLRRCLGVHGELLYLWANGVDNRPVLPPAVQQSFSRETTFSKDVLDRQMLLATLRYLTERVGASLREHHKQPRCVTLKLRYSDFSTITRQRMLRHFTNADNELFQIGRELLAQALKERLGRIRLIGIGASHLREAGLQPYLFLSEGPFPTPLPRHLASLAPAQLQHAQKSLWPKDLQRGQHLSLALDVIRQRHGFLAIQTGLTRRLDELYARDNARYRLKTSALSR